MYLNNLYVFFQDFRFLGLFSDFLVFFVDWTSVIWEFVNGLVGMKMCVRVKAKTLRDSVLQDRCKERTASLTVPPG